MEVARTLPWPHGKSGEKYVRHELMEFAVCRGAKEDCGVFSHHIGLSELRIGTFAVSLTPQAGAEGQ
jgi:hypothetical protein